MAADGAFSASRDARAQAFGTQVDWRHNRFVWYGSTMPFDTLTLTFRRHALGTFCAHHYRYAPDRSTFLVEVDEATYQRAGFETMPEADSLRLCEQVFAPDLQGHPLLSNRSTWRRFPVIRNTRFFSGRTVLIGDALRTVHFSIGSGTRLAMEDAIALAKALRAEADVDVRSERFQAEREPPMKKIWDAANVSLRWYERMGEHDGARPARVRLRLHDAQRPRRPCRDAAPRSHAGRRLRAAAPRTVRSLTPLLAALASPRGGAVGLGGPAPTTRALQCGAAARKLRRNAILRMPAANERTAAVCSASRFHNMPGVRTGVGLSSGTMRMSSRGGTACAATIAASWVRATRPIIGRDGVHLRHHQRLGAGGAQAVLQQRARGEHLRQQHHALPVQLHHAHPLALRERVRGAHTTSTISSVYSGSNHSCSASAGW